MDPSMLNLVTAVLQQAFLLLGSRIYPETSIAVGEDIFFSTKIIEEIPL